MSTSNDVRQPTIQTGQEDRIMKRIVTSTIAAAMLAGIPAIALAQDAPQFMRDTFPEAAVEGAWQGFQAVYDPDGALDGVTKELIAIGVSAQVPCDFCVYYHTEAARAHGASEEQIREALASAAMVRKWSTVLNGSQYDFGEWTAQVDAMFAGD
jgi:AhpD family alkylhydroperoxidase